MTTKKQLKTQERKRYEQLQRKIALRRQRRARNLRIGAVALLVIAVIALAWWGFTRDEAEPASGVSATPSPTSSATTEPDDDPTQGMDEEPVDAPTEDEVEFAEGWGASPAPPQPDYAEGRTWNVEVDTSQGRIVMELDGESAPQAVASFVALAQDDFFNQTDCHRLVTQGIFVLQCGDPLGTGTGGPSYRYGPIENAPEDDLYPAGTLAMARQGGNAESMGSQFFIVYDDSTIPSDAAGGYTVFGTVTEGLAIVEQVAEGGTIQGTPDGRPVLSVIINEVVVS